MRDAYNILIRKPGGRVWTGLFWLRIYTSERFL
jgi:hypothetical protein